MLTAPTWPDEASLAAFRAWLQGVPTRAAVDRYLPDRRTAGASARSVIGRVKRQLVAFATSRAQAELASTLAAASPSDRKLARAATAAIETLRGMPRPQPLIGDAVERWLHAHRITHAANHLRRLPSARAQPRCRELRVDGGRLPAALRPMLQRGRRHTPLKTRLGFRKPCLALSAQGYATVLIHDTSVGNGSAVRKTCMRPMVSAFPSTSEPHHQRLSSHAISNRMTAIVFREHRTSSANDTTLAGVHSAFPSSRDR